MASSDQAAGKAEAPKTLRKRLAEVFHRKSEAPEKVTFTDYADRYVEERELSEVYSDTLKRRAKQLQVFFRQPLYLDDLTEDLVNQYLLHIKKTRKVKPATIQSYRRDILSLWNGAADDEICNYPMMRRVRKPKSNTPTPVAWSQEQVEQLIAFCEGIPGETPSGIPSRLYWSACIRVGYDSALRASDMFRLKRKDIGPTGIVSVVMSKTRRRHLCKLRQSTIDAIAATFPPERDLIFEFGHRRTWTRTFKFLVELSGLSQGSFKYLRRTSGSLVESLAPGTGGKHLGHKSPGLFASHYEDVNLSRPNITQPPELKIAKGGVA